MTDRPKPADEHVADRIDDRRDRREDRRDDRETERDDRHVERRHEDADPKADKPS